MKNEKIIEGERVSEMNAARRIVVALKVIKRIQSSGMLDDGFESEASKSYLEDVTFLLEGVTLGDLTK